MDTLNIVWNGLTTTAEKISRILDPRYVVTLTTSNKQGKAVTRLIKPEQIKVGDDTIWVDLEDGSVVTVFKKADYKELAESGKDPSIIVMNSINSHFNVYKSCQLYDVIGEWF